MNSDEHHSSLDLRQETFSSNKEEIHQYNKKCHKQTYTKMTNDELLL